MHTKTQTALAELKRYMTLRHLTPGERLPSERELAALLGVGRGAVVSILNALAQMGEITLVGGRAYRAEKPELRRRKLLYLACCEVDFMVGQIPGSPLFRGICDAAEHFGMDLEIYHSDYCNLTYDYLERIRRSEFCAVIMLDTHHEPSVQTLLEEHIPCVIAGCECATEFPYTAVDFRAVGRLAAQELLAAGVKTFGTIAGAQNSWIYQEMAAGFRGGLAEAGYWLDDTQIFEIPVGSDVRQNADNMEVFFQKGIPEGIFAMRAYRAQFLYSYCLMHRIRIPEDVSVISFDQHTWGSAPDVGLSVIPEPRYQLGYQAVEMLSEWLQNGVRPASCKLLDSTIHRHSLRGEETAIRN